jgi:2-oxoglutarate ferredoxin oxidoreductase subunit alpha
VAESYWLTARAFELAERFRCPVFLMTDKELAMSLTTVDSDAFPVISAAERVVGSGGSPYTYEPHDQVFPLHEFGRGETVRFTGSSHNRDGYITKHAPTIDALNHHLSEKIEAHRDEIELVDLDLDPAATTVVVGYGVTGGAVRTAVKRSRDAGVPLSGAVVQSLWPIPETALHTAFADVDRVVVPELNLGLYRREIDRLTGDREVIGIERIDGELITPEQILEVV